MLGNTIENVNRRPVRRVVAVRKKYYYVSSAETFEPFYLPPENEKKKEKTNASTLQNLCTKYSPSRSAESETRRRRRRRDFPHPLPDFPSRPPPGGRSSRRGNARETPPGRPSETGRGTGRKNGRGGRALAADQSHGSARPVTWFDGVHDITLLCL